MLMSNPRTTPAPVLELRGAGRSYGRVRALHDVDLAVRQGEVVALLGPNGAGKTTAIHLLLGLIRPHAGSVALFGREPRDAAVRTRTGVMMQASGIPETLTVREHLEGFASYYPAPVPVPALLASTGLDEVADRLYGNLSGGQKQRLHLALALVGDPDVLFLDEPTTGLDVASRRYLWERVRAFVDGGRTVVLTTHDLDEADALADRVILLDHGEVVAHGTPGDIKARAAGRRVRAVTDVPLEALERLPGVAGLRHDGFAVELLVSDAEAVVRVLLRRDPNLSGLEVGDVGLEEAFLALTREREEVAA